MNSFATYIEYVLMTRHYVFVPGVGGFMLQRTGAKLLPLAAADGAAARMRVVPPAYEITFNRLMSHDDGLLANAYMEANDVDFATAEAYVRRESEAIRTALEATGRHALGSLGTLVRDADCHISFVAATPAVVPPAAFGLEAFEAARVDTPRAAAAKPAPKPESVITITLRRSWLRYAAIAAAIVVCLFCNVTPLHTRKDTDSHFAAILDGGIITDKRTPREIIDRTWEEVVNDASGDAEPYSTDSETPHGDAAPTAHNVTPHGSDAPTPATPSEVVAPAPTAQTNGKTYYIIVASCASRREADREKTRLAAMGYDELGILEKDGRFRLYIRTFQQKSQAEDYLTGLRVATAFHDAWLLPVRPDKHISKNKDNEPSFPMELSQLNTGTERDEG